MRIANVFHAVTVGLYDLLVVSMEEPSPSQLLVERDFGASYFPISVAVLTGLTPIPSGATFFLLWLYVRLGVVFRTSIPESVDSSTPYSRFRNTSHMKGMSRRWVV